ncbi:MAG: peptidase M16 [Desulfobacteraceae bacterium 4572_35.1]|nr:MAG: peptidase M16 [Desulfobacteraceae bacterium 4572_35.1]
MESTIKSNQIPEAFSLISTTDLPEINATLIQLRHRVTGARFVHIETDDSNNLFAVAFKTPPADSTGVAHILEHTALCGSKHYPVRDPFFTMLKRSLNTFMNAFTASDWTCYPFSSQNNKDFYNLLNIYLDAAFFPLLREQDFKQEGHRLEFSTADDPNSALCFKGVVYNEMKGAMADPASLLSRRTTRHLYPTTCYHHNSGGEPQDIPNLSWQQLRDFHAEFYHPSNACFFSYGNLPLTDHLQVIEQQVLAKFDARTVNSTVPAEQRLNTPLKTSEPFPLSANEDVKNKSMVHISWLTSDIDDSFSNLALTLLAQLLLGNPAAPLYKALLDSGLGSNLTPGCGFHDDYRTTCFAVGLQGTDPDKIDSIEDLVLTSLKKIADEGFTKERIEATIHRLELANREVSGDSYPYAISLMFRILGPWIHCDDPVSPLQLDNNLNLLRQKLAEGDFFENLIRTWLLDNNHRITLCLYPDKELQAKMDKQEQKQLEQIKKNLSIKEQEQIVSQAAQLQQSQEEKEDLSCLPTLELEDIEKDEPEIDKQKVKLNGTDVSIFPQPTNGIGYFELCFSCDHIDKAMRPYLPLFCGLLTQIGAGNNDYLQMAQRIEANTGGIRASVDILDDINNLDKYQTVLRLGGKALQRNLDKLADILADICCGANFADIERLATVIGQIKSSWENSIPNSGHSFAARAAAGTLTPAGKQREEWAGFSQLKLIKETAAFNGEQLSEFAKMMQKLTEKLFNGNQINAAITAEKQQLQAAQVAMNTLLSRLKQQTVTAKTPTPTTMTQEPTQLGWATSIPVSYVTQTFRTVSFTHPDSAPLKILAALLKANFLHREIREKGGAYGGMANSSSISGIFSLLSYRDPQLLRTIETYKKSLEWLQQGDFDQEKIKEAVLAVFSAYDRPLSPSGRGSHEFANQLQGLSHDKRQQFRNRLLAVTKEQLLDVGKRYLLEQINCSPISILSNEAALLTAQKTLTQLKIEQL